MGEEGKGGLELSDEIIILSDSELEMEKTDKELLGQFLVAVNYLVETTQKLSLNLARQTQNQDMTLNNPGYAEITTGILLKLKGAWEKILNLSPEIKGGYLNFFNKISLEQITHWTPKQHLLALKPIGENIKKFLLETFQRSIDKGEKFDKKILLELTQEIKDLSEEIGKI